jgi:hypothetical protein
MAKWAILSSMSMESYRESGGELNLGPAEDHKVLPYVLIALVVIAAIVAAVFWLNAHKTAELTVTHEDLFAPHTVYKPVPGAGNLIGAPGAIEDDLYVVATLRMTDKLRIPLFLDGMGATMTDADAEAGLAGRSAAGGDARRAGCSAAAIGEPGAVEAEEVCHADGPAAAPAA